MNIKIVHNAKEAIGIAVIIDVFRAFTVEPYIINNGAKKLIAVGDKQIAYDFKQKNSDYILIGEREGVKLPGFDYGNSPSQIENVNFSNKVVIHTTSCGTQGVVNAINAVEIITGSFVNDQAIVKYIKQSELIIADCSRICGDDSHMGIDNLEYLIKNYDKKIITTHVKDETREKLINLKYDNILVKEDGYKLKI